MERPVNSSKPSCDEFFDNSDGEDILRYFDYTDPPSLDLKPLPAPQPSEMNSNANAPVPVAKAPAPAPLPQPPPPSYQAGRRRGAGASFAADEKEGSPWDVGFIEALLQRLAREVDVNLGIESGSYSKPLTVPYTPGDFECNDCYNLRDIMHTSGTRNVRVTLHGGKDVFDHLLFQIEIFDQNSINLEHYYLDLSNHPFMWTKWLLALYLNFVIEDGSAVLMDFSSTFYNFVEVDAKPEYSPSDSSSSYDSGQELSPEAPSQDDQALPSSISHGNNVPAQSTAASQLLASSAANSSQSNSTESGEGRPVDQPAAQPSDAPQQGEEEPCRPPPRPRVRARARASSRIPKTGLALQRERAGKLTLEDLSPYFNRPIIHAAKELGFCSTAIKHACRRIGIGRWPSRKLNSVGRQIENLEKELRNVTERDRMQDINNEIEKLQAQREKLRNGDQNV